MATTLTQKIVTLNTTVTVAPTPSQLQQSGALISVGGTTLATSAYQFVGSLSALEAVLSAAGNYAELNTMGTTFFAQGNVAGCYVLELGANVDVITQVNSLQTWITNNPDVFYSFLTPADWDTLGEEVGSVTITSGGTGYSSAPTVTFSAASGGGTTATATANISGGGVVTAVTITNAGYYPNQATPTVTFSAPTSGATATGTVVMANAFNVLSGDYASPTAKLYFFGTTIAANVGQYAPNKSLLLTATSPTATASEFQAAAPFYQWQVNSPGAANKLAPMGFRYLYGVTPWAASGQTANINTVLTAHGNVILTGAEGGISNTALFKGFLMSGDQASWWYGIDWFQIQVKQAMAAAILNGSNSNPPLLYDQDGINTLQSVAQQVANTAVTFGCALSAVVSATPFYTYSQENPADYKAGIYNGFSAIVVGQNGFTTITFNLDAVEFA